MAVVQLFISATKLAGLIVTLSVAANALSFARFRRKFLRPFRSPIAADSDTLADFNPSNEEDDEENREFFFGLATAPAHVEDGLSDAWLEFAEQKEDKEGSSSLSLSHRNVAAWHNVPRPEERLRFWSDPDTELKLARDTGVTVFRMGIDWSRIVPTEPQNNLHDIVNYAALERYKWIMERVHSYGMKVMLTLFHHSLPPWAAEYGGWKLERTVDHFIDFTRVVVESVSELVDYWVTFNEPHVFAMLTYSAGTWPGGNPGVLEAATSVLPTGVFQQAMHWMAVAHLKAYDIIHNNRSASKKKAEMVGVAHHVSFMRPYGLFDIAAVSLATSLTVFPYVDAVSEKLNFIGINYYGQEVVCAGGLKLVETDEYSESGRGVYPDGLFRMLLEFHERYKHLKVPFMVTENGVSDDTDIIRQPYLVEHLLAVFAAMAKGVPVLGYMFWTISDNWEWADGYGPKFGLVAVDRANDLARNPRPSYHLFTKIAKSGKVTRKDRAVAWNKLRRATKEKKTHPFYREVNRYGFMYSAGLDEPIERRFVDRDWRFGHYEMEGLQDPLSRFLRLLARPLFLFSKKTRHEEEEEEVPLVLQPQI